MTYFLGDKETLPGSGWRHLNGEKRGKYRRKSTSYWCEYAGICPPG